MKNLKVRSKIILVFGCIFLMITILIGFSIVTIRGNSNTILNLYDGPYTNTKTVLTLENNLYKMDGSLKCMLVDGSVADDKSELEETVSDANDNLVSLKAGNALSSDQASGIEAFLSGLTASGQEIMSLIEKGSFAEAEDRLADFEEEIESGMTVINSAAADIEKAAANFRDQSLGKTNRSIFAMDVIFAVTVLLSIFLACRVSLTISRPLGKLSAGMKEVYKGNFDIELSSDSKDEIGVLTRQLNETITNIKNYIHDITHVLGEISRGNIDLSIEREYIGDFSEIKNSLLTIITSLNRTMDNIRHCCDEVRNGSASLAEGSRQLAGGSAEQASEVENFQRFLNQAAGLTQEDSKNAAAIQDLSAKTREAVRESNGEMQDMMRAMDEINASSNEIAKVIKIIEDIAFQTNILALNASVEAARAGEAGKGFAVVAGEVGSLASKSAEAANNITSMIEKAIGSVNNGLKIAEIAAGSLNKVEKNVISMSGALAKIDASTQEQAKAFAEMVHSSEQISGVIKLNSAAAEENSAASEELSGQAQILDDLVSQFRTSASRLRQKAGRYTAPAPSAEASVYLTDQKY